MQSIHLGTASKSRVERIYVCKLEHYHKYAFNGYVITISDFEV